jgi:hypothetical protein
LAARSPPRKGNRVAEHLLEGMLKSGVHVATVKIGIGVFFDVVERKYIRKGYMWSSKGICRVSYIRDTCERN